MRKRKGRLRNPKLKIDWLRVEAAFYDLPEIGHDKNVGMISFRGSKRERMNVYTTTATVVVQPRHGSWSITKGNSFEKVVTIMSGLSRY